MAKLRSEKEILEHGEQLGLITPKREPTTMDGIMVCSKALGDIMQAKLPPDVGFVTVLFLKGEPEAFGLAASHGLSTGKIVIALRTAKEKVRQLGSRLHLVGGR